MYSSKKTGTGITAKCSRIPIPVLFGMYSFQSERHLINLRYYPLSDFHSLPIFEIFFFLS